MLFPKGTSHNNSQKISPTLNQEPSTQPRTRKPVSCPCASLPVRNSLCVHTVEFCEEIVCEQRSLCRKSRVKAHIKSSQFSTYCQQLKCHHDLWSQLLYSYVTWQTKPEPEFLSTNVFLFLLLQRPGKIFRFFPFAISTTSFCLKVKKIYRIHPCLRHTFLSQNWTAKVGVRLVHENEITIISIQLDTRKWRQNWGCVTKIILGCDLYMGEYGLFPEPNTCEDSWV